MRQDYAKRNFARTKKNPFLGILMTLLGSGMLLSGLWLLHHHFTRTPHLAQSTAVEHFATVAATVNKPAVTPVATTALASNHNQTTQFDFYKLLAQTPHT